MIAATDMHIAIEELLESVFSMRPVPRTSYHYQRAKRESAGRQFRAAVAEAGDSWRTQRKRNVRGWKPLPSNCSEGCEWEH
jgi:hypothetical protein